MGMNSQVDTIKQKQAMLDALEANMGNITKSAKEAGISIRTHYRWRMEDNDYDTRVVSMRDICFTKVKDSLLDSALKRIAKGDGTVLNQMLRLFYKNLPREMMNAAWVNERGPRAVIKWVDTPQDPKREGYVKPEE
jgi:hypothetical protein